MSFFTSRNLQSFTRNRNWYVTRLKGSKQLLESIQADPAFKEDNRLNKLIADCTKFIKHFSSSWSEQKNYLKEWKEKQ